MHFCGCLRPMISIHALREEGDKLGIFLIAVAVVFLSTPSARRATYRADVPKLGVVISIHALREEGDGHSRSRRCSTA